EPLDANLARDTHLEALWAGHLDSPSGVTAAAEAARAAPPGPEPTRAADLLLEAFALRLTQGYAAAAPLLTRALELSLTPAGGNDEAGIWRRLADGRAGAIVALEVWDAESWHALAAVQAQFTRDTGALVHLQYALNLLAMAHLFAGELTTAARLVDEDRLITEVTGNPPVGYAAMALPAWQGQEAPASALIESTSQAATARGLGRMVSFADYASSVLYNGLGRYDAARDPAWRAFQRDELGCGPYVVPELAEAAARTGDEKLVRAALQWLTERTRLAPTEWSLGIEARVRARSARARPPSGTTASRSIGWGAPAFSCSWPERICSTASGCAASDAASTRARSCVQPAPCWRRWASTGSPSEPGVSCGSPARPPASGRSRPARS
ncbi:MAG TPA: hypothetical protein VJ735_14035, partial [Actinomycetes bacterium]|nr:hypothetical protein [Actinomycetes bacterium]